MLDDFLISYYNFATNVIITSLAFLLLSILRQDENLKSNIISVLGLLLFPISVPISIIAIIISDKIKEKRFNEDIANKILDSKIKEYFKEKQ